MRELQHLLNCLNAVTCKHRHGQPISKRRLDDLSNAQVDYEQAVQPGPMVPLRLVEEIAKAIDMCPYFEPGDYTRVYTAIRAAREGVGK